MNSTQATVAGERADLLASLGRQRSFLRYTVRDLTDEQARQRTTASELCLGGLIKHVAAVERRWMRFIADGPSALADRPQPPPAATTVGNRGTGRAARLRQLRFA